jgi:hypothetical protein
VHPTRQGHLKADEDADEALVRLMWPWLPPLPPNGPWGEIVSLTEFGERARQRTERRDRQLELQGGDDGS